MATDVLSHELKQELRDEPKGELNQEEGYSGSTPSMSASPTPCKSPMSASSKPGTTPSKPAKSPANGSKTQGSGSRRPARKSTLTQQQKNQKRQRATQDQLTTLEMEFNKNPTPTAGVRERIAEEINMTERSVQIWFQNR